MDFQEWFTTKYMAGKQFGPEETADARHAARAGWVASREQLFFDVFDTSQEALPLGKFPVEIDGEPE